MNNDFAYTKALCAVKIFTFFIRCFHDNSNNAYFRIIVSLLILVFISALYFRINIY